MRLKPFQAPDLARALTLARQELGPDALVLATNEIRGRMGLTSVEITVAIDLPVDSSVGAPLTGASLDQPLGVLRRKDLDGNWRQWRNDRLDYDTASRALPPEQPPLSTWPDRPTHSRPNEGPADGHRPAVSAAGKHSKRVLAHPQTS